MVKSKRTTPADPIDRSLARPTASRRNSGRLIAKAQERLSLLSSVNSLGFWRWNRATDVVWASRQARSILGLNARTQLTRDTLIAAIHPLDRASVIQAISASASHSNIVEMELRTARQDGEVRWITAKACAYRDANGMILRVVGLVIDDSKIKRAEAESLVQRQQITHLTRVALLGELSGALSHELQQPLAAILSDAQTAQLLTAQASFSIETVREILTDIVSEDKRAGQIIHSLRALLMRGETQFVRLEMADLIRHVLTLARSTLAERKVQIDLRIAEDVSAVLGDQVELQQVLLNLVLNACEAMSANAAGDRRIEIIVTAEAEQRTVRTSILDVGQGIDPEHLDHIFDPFVTTKKSGLGLGLGVCRSIILAHNGQLWATNRAGRGAAFHFTLLVASRERQQ